MLDEAGRRQKARKIVAILSHFLGRDDLSGLLAADVGCSTGFLADELHQTGATVIGCDIDVPGLARASSRFGDRVAFVCADGQQAPFPDGAFDVLIFNHIYEHVVDADAVVAELHRILAPDGVVYFGLGNKYGILEPHYRLPFLSYLPPAAADRYVRLLRRAPEYYERHRSRRELAAMTRAFHVWDYTYTVLADPERFAADDVPALLSRTPTRLLRALQPIMPTFLWVGAKSPRAPRGPAVRSSPTPVTG